MRTKPITDQSENSHSLIRILTYQILDSQPVAKLLLADNKHFNEAVRTIVLRMSDDTFSNLQLIYTVERYFKV